jgi:hypothetical protein
MARDGQIDVLQVMLPRAADDQVVSIHAPLPYGRWLVDRMVVVKMPAPL